MSGENEHTGCAVGDVDTMIGRRFTGRLETWRTIEIVGVEPDGRYLVMNSPSGQRSRVSAKTLASHFVPATPEASQ
jgi:hypothetical protein